MKYGDTGLELGDLVREETEEFGTEVEETTEDQTSGEDELTEEENEILAEFKEASPKDFIRAIKTYKDRAKKTEEARDFYRDLYNSVPMSALQTQPKQFKRKDESEIDDSFGDLAKKGDVQEIVVDALEAEKINRRNEQIRQETYVFAKDKPDFYERLDAVSKLAENDPKLRAIIENHPRPWEFVYETAVKSGAYEPKTAEGKGSKVDELKKIKENATKVKPLFDQKSKPVQKKSIKDMTDEEFAKHYAEVRSREQ